MFISKISKFIAVHALGVGQSCHKADIASCRRPY